MTQREIRSRFMVKGINGRDAMDTGLYRSKLTRIESLPDIIYSCSKTISDSDHVFYFSKTKGNYSHEPTLENERPEHKLLQIDVKFEWYNGLYSHIAQLVEKLDHNILNELCKGEIPKQLLTNPLIQDLKIILPDGTEFIKDSNEWIILVQCAIAKIWRLKSNPEIKFNNLYFERNAQHSFTADESFRRAIVFNARHAYPHEAFGFLIAGLEDKLNAEQISVAKNMYFCGEWLGADFKREGDELFVYLEHIPEKAITIFGALPKNSEGVKFNIKGISSQEFVELREFPEGFAKLIYGRNFKDLPRQIKTGGYRAQVYLPPPDGIRWPLSRGMNNHHRYGIIALNAMPNNIYRPSRTGLSKYPSRESEIAFRASRWVREK